MRKTIMTAVFVLAFAAISAAQVGRVGGTVKDDTGNPIKGASVMAENPNSSPNSLTATTDDKGRFSIIGLKTGAWTFTAQAPGFEPMSGRLDVKTVGAPNPPLEFKLKKGSASATSALGNLAAKDLQAELASADNLYNAQRWDDAIAAYRAIMAKAPALSVINLQIAAAYRNKKDYDAAIAAYNELLKVDPNNDKAKIGIGMTNLEKGDLAAADQAVGAVAQTPGASRDAFYDLGDIKLALSQTDAAVNAYQRAAEADKTWGKPVLALGRIAMTKGDLAGASKFFQTVITVDPASPEAEQAKTLLAQITK